jgi:hypothetical protein
VVGASVDGGGDRSSVRRGSKGKWEVGGVYKGGGGHGTWTWRVVRATSPWQWRRHVAGGARRVERRAHRRWCVLLARGTHAPTFFPWTGAAGVAVEETKIGRLLAGSGNRSEEEKGSARRWGSRLVRALVQWCGGITTARLRAHSNTPRRRPAEPPTVPRRLILTFHFDQTTVADILHKSGYTFYIFTLLDRSRSYIYCFSLQRIAHHKIFNRGIRD